MVAVVTTMPSNTYYDMILAQLLDTGLFGPTQQAGARSMASEASDAMLRGQLGSKRKLGKHERMPEGAYTSTKYPGFEQQLFGAESGFVPRGYSWRGLAGESTQDRMERERRQREWAQQQRAMLGMGRY